MTMNKAAYISIIQQEAALFASTVHKQAEPPIPQIPSCPDWNMIGLLLHLGRNHRFATKRIRDRELDAPKAGPPDLSFLNLQPEYLEWLKTNQAPSDKPLPFELIKWFDEGVKELVEALNEVEPETPVWNFLGTDRTNAGFYQRQMAIETSLHRWDAQGATPHQKPNPIDTEMARDGLDLFFKFLPVRRKRIKEPPGNGELYHFHRTDGEGEWLVRFEGDETIITEEHGKGDVAIRGTASNLLLFLWRRIPAEQVEVFGDAVLIKRYFELVPPI